jgi:hypothetical protein
MDIFRISDGKIVDAGFLKAQEYPVVRKKSVGSSLWHQCSTIFRR